jgi:predicted metalloprotease
MRTRGVGSIALLAIVGLAACSVDPVVTAERSDQIVTVTPESPGTTTAPAPDDVPPEDTAPEDVPPDDPAPEVTSPDDSTPGSTTAPAPSIEPAEIDPAAINFGSNKTPNDYDDFLLAVMTDLDAWWTEQYPELYGGAFQSLVGGTFAAYPERPDDLPGCGEPRTTYDDVQQFVAFYCGEGDFIIYDDGDDGMLASLAEQYGPGTIGIVFAHEFGHAIQTRAGELDSNLPTIFTEQQADCFAGAWAARVSRGESSVLSFSDADVRSGLIAMTKVSDPVGVDQFVAGGHGSAFDRVGAFQVGFSEGVARCTELLDSPLPLSPNQFNQADVVTGGNAVLGYEEGELLEFIPIDLNQYWNDEVASTTGAVGEIAFVGATSSDDVDCDDPAGAFVLGAVYCPSSHTVFLNEPAAQEIYDALGDFSVGYLIGTQWSEAVQQALDSDLEGEARALMNDCLTGSWVKTTILVDGQYPQPRAEGREVSVSAGDLDEAIQTIIGISDESSDDDVRGGLFEKIDAFRQGVVNGLDSCLADL